LFLIVAINNATFELHQLAASVGTQQFGIRWKSLH